MATIITTLLPPPERALLCSQYVQTVPALRICYSKISPQTLNNHLGSGVSRLQGLREFATAEMDVYCGPDFRGYSNTVEKTRGLEKPIT